jgi:hypothetical protein
MILVSGNPSGLPTEVAMNKSYHSYLLRVWQSNERGQPVWLASLEDPHTRRVIHFNKLEELWRFLKNQASGSDAPPPHPENQKENDQ